MNRFHSENILAEIFVQHIISFFSSDELPYGSAYNEKIKTVCRCYELYNYYSTP